MRAEILQDYWQQLLQPYTSDQALIEDTYRMFTLRYMESHRLYHNLHHLHTLLELQETYAKHIKDNETFSLAIFFHDLIYDVTQSDNEEQSALAAGAFLEQINYPAERKEQVMEFIRATKTHRNTTGNTDLDYFLDFDLAILSAPGREYLVYTKQIREEYGIYPDDTFRNGRKRVLAHFLGQPAIYKTDLFREQHEAHARRNIQEELEALGEYDIESTA